MLKEFTFFFKLLVALKRACDCKPFLILTTTITMKLTTTTVSITA